MISKENSQFAIINNNIFQDLEFYNILVKIDYTKTFIGRLTLENLIRNPISNRTILLQRQNEIEKYQRITDFSIDWIHYKSWESILYQIWQPLTEDTHKLYNLVLYENSYLTRLNQIPMALNGLTYINALSPLFQILSPIITMLIPIIIFQYYGIPINYQMLSIIIQMIWNNSKRELIISGGLYFYTSYQSIQVAIKRYQIISDIYNKVSQIKTMLLTTDRIFTKYQSIIPRSGVKNSIEYLIKLLDINPFDIGKLLWTFFELKHNTTVKTHFSRVLSYIGILDVYQSIKDLQDHGYHNAIYLANQKPVVQGTGLWHPLVERNIKNNISLDHIGIITGPNAGGKSTFMKSILINILLSQTLTVTNAESFSLTPFKLIHSYLNIPDTTGKESLFQAEMNRVYEYFKSLSELDQKQFAFVIMDEVFTSTNHIEGVAGAMAVCEELAENQNAIGLVTTHFDKLTELESQNPRFKNYKVSLDIIQDQIDFHYKVVPGISKQHVALLLLKQKGFDHRLIDRALGHLGGY